MPLRSPTRSRTPTSRLTKTQVERRAHARVALYLDLYEHEGWPPGGPHGIGPVNTRARQLLARLSTLMTTLWNALPATSPLTRQALMRRTSAAGTLHDRHQALRLGRCCGLLRGERRTNYIWRVPPWDPAPSR